MNKLMLSRLHRYRSPAPLILGFFVPYEVTLGMTCLLMHVLMPGLRKICLRVQQFGVNLIFVVAMHPGTTVWILKPVF